jgi:hypothetical protein
MSCYFKQFQKDAYKLYLPFSQIGKKELLLVFYPLYQGGILHHLDGMFVEESSEDSVEWCLELLGTAFSVREKELPVFYRLCIDNEIYSFV